MRRGLATLALLAATALAGCATQAEAGPSEPNPVTKTPPPTTTTTTTTVVPPPPPPPPCAPNVAACVSLSTKQAWLLTNGAPTLGPVRITHGGTTNPTPTGTWPVAWKDEVHTSSIYGDPMPYSVFFAPGGIAFHEGKLDENSHGCIRLEMPNAQAFFNTLQIGALVQVVP